MHGLRPRKTVIEVEPQQIISFGKVAQIFIDSILKIKAMIEL